MLALAAAPSPARATDPTGTVCVVHHAAVPGLDQAALAQALRLEQRKASTHLTIAEASEADACTAAPPPLVVLVIRSAGDVRVLTAEPSPRPLDVSSVEPLDRSQVVARAVIAAHTAPDGGQAPLLRGSDTLEHSRLLAVEETAPGPTEPRAVRALIEAGGSYTYQPADGLHVGSVELGAGVALFDERLVVLAVGGWQVERTVPGSATPATVEAATLLAIVRGGPRLGPVLLRFGAGGGWEWRRVAMIPATRFEVVEHSSGAGALRAEVEVVWPATPWLGLALGIHGQWYLGGQPLSWLSETVYAAPTGAVGTALRASASF